MNEKNWRVGWEITGVDLIMSTTFKKNNIFIYFITRVHLNQLVYYKKKHDEKTQKPLNANSFFFLRVNGSFYCSLKSENTKKLLKQSLKNIYLLRMIKSFYYTDKIWKDLIVLVQFKNDF